MVRNVAEYAALKQAVDTGQTPAAVVGLSAVHKAHFISGLVADTGRPILIITEDEAVATRLCEDVNAMTSPDTCMLFPAKDFNFYSVEGASKEYEYKRLAVLSRLCTGECRVVAASIEAVQQLTLPRQALEESAFTLRTGESHTLEELARRLVDAGYTRCVQVDGVSQFSIRGAILDVFPVQSTQPVRVELWGDEIDTISLFDLESQRRTQLLQEIRVTAASEVVTGEPQAFAQKLEEFLGALKGKSAQAVRAQLSGDVEKLRDGVALPSADKYLQLVYEKPETILDYLDDPIIVFSEYVTIRERSKEFLAQHAEDIRILFEDHELCAGLDTFTAALPAIQAQAQRGCCLYFDTFARTSGDLRLKTLINITAFQLSPWGGELKMLSEDLSSLIQRGYACLVMAGTEKAGAALAADLRKAGIPADYTNDPKNVILKKVQVTQSCISGGMEYPTEKLAVISHVGMHTAARRVPKKKKKEEIRSLSDLSVGDYVVHVSHGIGVFSGIRKMEVGGVLKDYLQIRYAGTDVLYVPVTQLDLVSKYIGPKEDSGVKLNKLNSTEWNKTRSRVKSAVKEMAKELIALYAKRMQVKGHAFPPDNDWQQQFEEHFPYQETDDQLRCIDEIKADMQRTAPMDRLLCGDVGFGKTEVALRAAFKAILDGKQVAILVPTTVLAWQHYQTILKRMEPFPVKAELLSRFRSQKQQGEIVKQLRRGEVDIVVGTHRLVQKDISFRDLGLVIIDEEQRFGVAHKEKLKELYPGVDVLTLSATPIPRTLNMAMSGIRDMSTIEEAPQDRHPVQTYVIEYDLGVLAEAIRKELRRGGQVYYVHNRIDTIDLCAAKLREAVPDLRVGIAHGRMDEAEVSRVWKQLIEHEIDILVCTTLIETGVDVPNCNTLIIENADNMGLSQLYQLRGRVGRSSRRAFAYFTFQRGKAMSEVASKRLNAIREFTQFGSGFRIALRDLEIRGAGNILGARQHGHMEAVGYEMYLRLLSDAIAEQKGEAPEAASRECLVDVQIEAHIPENYIENLAQRIEVYKKIASIKTDEDSYDVVDELIDRFGEPPKAVGGLIDVALLRNKAAQLGVSEIIQRQEFLLFYVEHIDMQLVARVSAALGGRVLLSATDKPYLSLKMGPRQDAIDAMREFLDAAALSEESQQQAGTSRKQSS